MLSLERDQFSLTIIKHSTVSPLLEGGMADDPSDEMPSPIFPWGGIGGERDSKFLYENNGHEKTKSNQP